jgi:hypothetical protein
MAGVVTCIARWVVAENRLRTPTWAESMAWASPGDTVRRRASRLPEVRQVPADQPVQPQQHRFGMFTAARQRRRPRHQACFFAHAAMPRAHETAGDRGVEPRRRRRHAAVQRAVRGGPGACRPAHRRLRVGARAADEGPQVDFGQHTLLDQVAVGVVVGLFDQVREFFMQHGLQFTPAVQAQPPDAPGFEHHAGQHMRAQQVVRFQFGAAFQRGHARAQVGKLPRRAVHDGQRQPGGDDFQFDGVVVDQRQADVAARPTAGRRCATRRLVPTIAWRRPLTMPGARPGRPSAVLAAGRAGA